MKIIVTGGHLTPALACIDTILNTEEYKHTRIVFVGRKYALDSENTLSFEFREVRRRKIKFIHLKAGRFTRLLSWQSIIHLGRIPHGFIQAWQIMRKEHPRAVLSFGGYIALPIAVVGWCMRIPVYTHEQTIKPGMTNKIIALFARKVFVAFPQAKHAFNHRSVVISGNPLRKHIFINQTMLFEKPPDSSVLYITGGSLGSHSINMHIERILPAILERYIVIHQVGNVKQFNDFQRLSKVKDNLPRSLYDRYIIKKHVADEEIGYIYSIAHLVISRSGANTCFELIALRKPAILIPLPWSGNQEQLKQADLLKRAGVAEIFHQRKKSQDLLILIDSMMSQIENYRNHFDHITYLDHSQASHTIVRTMFEA